MGLPSGPQSLLLTSLFPLDQGTNQRPRKAHFNHDFSSTSITFEHQHRGINERLLTQHRREAQRNSPTARIPSLDHPHARFKPPLPGLTSPMAYASPNMSQIPDSSAPSPSPSSSTPSDAPTPLSPLQRKINQMGLLLAGAGFMAASIAVTRRAVIRRQVESFPKFYSSNKAVFEIDSGERSLMAVQALGLATLNVMSFGVMLTGGIMYSFDLCNIGELRARTQAALRTPGNYSAEDEKEVEKIMSSILDRLGMQKPDEWQKEAEKEAAKASEETESKK